jgi:hypothetical protein
MVEKWNYDEVYVICTCKSFNMGWFYNYCPKFSLTYQLALRGLIDLECKFYSKDANVGSQSTRILFVEVKLLRDTASKQINGGRSSKRIIGRILTRERKWHRQINQHN